MYEFGDYGTRVQDPLDPNYEYNTRNITRTWCVGESTCTYEEVMKFVNRWNMNYNLVFNNCQEFAKELGDHLKANCSSSRNRRNTHGNYCTSPPAGSISAGTVIILDND